MKLRYQLIALLSLSGVAVQAGTPPRALRADAVDARNEAATPGFAGPLRESARLATLLGDALLLSRAQQRAVQACLLAEREALVLAATPADAAQAHKRYLAAVRQVLATSQLHAYHALSQQLAGTAFPLDGAEVAVR